MCLDYAFIGKILIFLYTLTGIFIWWIFIPAVLYISMDSKKGP